MESKANNVAYMKEYLRQAMVFEKFVYIWNQSMNEANGYVKDVYNEKERLEQQELEACLEIQTYEPMEKSEYKKIYKEEKKERKRQKSFLKSTLSFIAFIFCFEIVGGLIAESGLLDAAESDVEFILTGAAVVLVILLIGFILSKMYNRRKIKERFVTGENSRKRQVVIAQENERKAQQKLAIVSVREARLAKSQQDIFKELNEAKDIRSYIYSENVLPAKYRSFNAVATLYEYLETGRCNTIQGHGGIYDTYEYDMKLGLIINNLVEINSRLADIQRNQRLLYDEFRQANQTLSNISSTLKNIENISIDIEKNTAISAAANQQTAAASSYMAWHTWHNS